MARPKKKRPMPKPKQPIEAPQSVSSDKQVLLTVKLPESLRDAFNAACASNDETGAQVLRKTIRKYVAENGQAKLF